MLMPLTVLIAFRTGSCGALKSVTLTIWIR